MATKKPAGALLSFMFQHITQFLFASLPAFLHHLFSRFITHFRMSVRIYFDWMNFFRYFVGKIRQPGSRRIFVHLPRRPGVFGLLPLLSCSVQSYNTWCSQQNAPCTGKDTCTGGVNESVFNHISGTPTHLFPGLADTLAKTCFFCSVTAAIAQRIPRPAAQACSSAGWPWISPGPVTPPANTVPARVAFSKQSTQPCRAVTLPATAVSSASAAVASR